MDQGPKGHLQYQSIWFEREIDENNFGQNGHQNDQNDGQHDQNDQLFGPCTVVVVVVNKLTTQFYPIIVMYLKY